MTGILKLVLFRIDDLRLAVPLGSVERTVRMVALTPLPSAPEIIRGMVNCQGALVPVADLRARLSLPSREPAPEDRLLIVRAPKRLLGLIADDVDGVATIDERDIMAPELIHPSLAGCAGAAALPDGVLLIVDMESFLAADEERSLERALGSGEEAGA